MRRSYTHDQDKQFQPNSCEVGIQAGIGAKTRERTAEPVLIRGFNHYDATRHSAVRQWCVCVGGLQHHVNSPSRQYGVLRRFVADASFKL
jgi:hypothetical protein